MKAWKIGVLVLVGLVLTLVIVTLILLLVLNPPVENCVVVSSGNDGSEGLFSRMNNWVGTALFAERHGAAGVILRSKDSHKQYSKDGGDLCRKLLYQSEHALRENGLASKKFRWYCVRRFTDQLWLEREKHNRGFPSRASSDWATMQRAFLRFGRFRDDLEAHADQFFQHKFGDSACVIGIHWRGTDTATRWPYVKHTPDTFLTRVQEILQENVGKACWVFVASDEKTFVDKCKESFGERCVYQEMERSAGKQPLHKDSSRDPEETAKTVIQDALVLSKCHHLVKGRSCVSDYSIFRNPDMAVDLFLNGNGRHFFRPPGGEFQLVK
jgi:hypothetical protein